LLCFSSVYHNGQEEGNSRKDDPNTLWPSRGLYGEDFSQSGDPVFSVGLISDLQYVDRPDRRTRGMTRRYRHSMQVLDRAIEAWGRENISQVVVLGDTVDMSSSSSYSDNQKKEKEEESPLSGSTETLKVVLDKLEDDLGGLGKKKIHFVLGNHDVASIPRPELLSLLGVREKRRRHTKKNIDQDDDDGDELAAYYSETNRVALEVGQSEKGGGGDKQMKKVKFIFLDSFDISVYWPESHEHRSLADEILRRKRSSFLPFSLWGKLNNLKSSAMLFGLDKRFVSLGGGLGGRQLRWLEEEVREACHAEGEEGTKVVVFSHIPISPLVCSDRCGYTCLLWNYDQANQALMQGSSSHSHSNTTSTSSIEDGSSSSSSSSSSCVKAFFAGHDHPGGYAFDPRSGVHHVTLFGAVETGPQDTAFAVLDFYPSGMVLRGAGRNIEPRWIPF
jgi:hypothetical protein